MKKKESVDRTMFKKTGAELQDYLQFRRRGSKVESRKGKGSYSRKQKHRDTQPLCA